MNILFISQEGDGKGLVEQVKREGHNAPLIFLSEANIMRANGYPIEANIRKLLDEIKPDLCVFDGVGAGRVADFIKGLGVSVLGACNWADHATSDQLYAHKLMRSCDIPPAHKSVEGVRVECEMWWDGLHSIVPTLIHIDSRLMTGDVGPETGYEGSVVRVVQKKSRLISEGVGRLEKLLKKTSYTGPISLSSIVTGSKLYGINIKAHIRRESIYPLLELYKGSVAELLHGIVNGSNRAGKFSYHTSISVHLSIPPYPYSPRSHYDDKEIGGVDENNAKHIWFKDVSDGGTIGSDVGCVTARGRDVGECRKRVYRTIHNLVVKDLQYRTDIGERVSESEKKLKVWNYLS